LSTFELTDCQKVKESFVTLNSSDTTTSMKSSQKQTSGLRMVQNKLALSQHWCFEVWSSVQHKRPSKKFR